MYLPQDRIAPALAAWIEQELIPQTRGWERALGYMAAIAIAKRGEQLAAEFAPALKILGLTDGEGRVDIDAARALAQEALAKTGKIHALGFVFGPDDVDSLAAIAETQAA